MRPQRSVVAAASATQVQTARHGAGRAASRTRTSIKGRVPLGAFRYIPGFMLPGSIGPFRIERELGRGGMGEVYLARDTRLDRPVAIKALPVHLAQDPDRLARFQREAKVLASLNHSGIGAIYGLEEANGHHYLILEYIEGETLAQRLSRGALPVDDALSIARQIAEALEVAHEKGVIHRDLKPGNVMVTADGAAKVLDFGLARTEEGTPASSVAPSLTDSPTVTSPGRFPHSPPLSPTIPGMIMGTAGYMSPEQARGKPVDKRSDIFSFGCVLYEMLTGTMPFRGETVADVISATLHLETEHALLPAETPSRVRELLATCLAKDRKNRLHDIGDARIALERAIASPTENAVAARASRAWWTTARGLTAISLASAAVIAVAALVFREMQARGQRDAAAMRAPKQVVRFTIAPPAGYTLPLFVADGTGIAISPAGDRIVFVAESKGKPHLCVRDIASNESRVLPGTESCTKPFFSPDGKWIGCASGNRILKMPADGGPMLTICEAANSSFAWLDNGMIVWGAGTAGLWRVNADGGKPEQMAAAGATTKAVEGGGPVLGFDVPVRVPGADYLLCCSWDGPTTESFNVLAVSLKDGSLRTVLRAATEPRLIARDRLLFMRGTTVMTVGFDPERGVTVGDPTVAVEGVRTDQWGDSAYIGASLGGTFAYVPGGRFGADKRLVLVDASGTATPVLDTTDNYNGPPVISPDGRRVSITTLRHKLELWVLDLERRSMSIVTSEGEIYGTTWTRDGKSILAQFVNNEGKGALVRWKVGGSSEPEILTNTSLEHTFFTPAHELPDGSGIVTKAESIRVESKPDIVIYDYATASMRPVRSRAVLEDDPCLSPDGTLLAYVSDESGRRQVSVGPLEGGGPDTQISSNGGFWPRFSWDGTRVFFIDASDMMMGVTIENRDGAIVAGPPTKVFDLAKLNLQSSGRGGFSVLPNGSFLMTERAAWEKEPPEIRVILNWADELAEQVAARPR